MFVTALHDAARHCGARHRIIERKLRDNTNVMFCPRRTRMISCGRGHPART
jgi:hypothetical protein